jgi:hypothetical protein
MPAPPKPPVLKAAEPRYGRSFDPWNSVALGHQRAETNGPQGWRENRTWKLQHQLAAGNSGGDRLSDAVGAGSEDYDEDRGVLIPKEVRERATNSVMDMLRKPGTMSRHSSRPGSRSPERKGGGSPPEAVDETAVTTEEKTMIRQKQEDEGPEAARAGDARVASKIFDGLVVYINGSTHPLISDHKLKHVLVENGARMSIHLGRRKVTHVILGKPSGPNGGAGGGLAGGKLEKEIRRKGGCGVKYVGVEW